MQVTIGAASDVGHVRGRNEDAHLVLTELGLVAVADGLGGHQAGDLASRIAVELLHERASAVDAVDAVDAEAVVGWLHDANDAIASAAADEPGRDGMGTTAVAAILPADASTVSIVHVGDSRAYLRAADGLTQVTTDHAERGGNLITQALGIGEIAPDVTHVPVAAGDVLLLCTDGLTDMLDDDEIERALAADADPQTLADELVAGALERGGIDNVTVVVVTIDP